MRGVLSHGLTHHPQEVILAHSKWLEWEGALLGKSNPTLGFNFQRKKCSSPLTCKDSILCGSLRYREVACSASDLQGSNFEVCVCRAVSPHSSYHPQEVILIQFSLYMHKGGLKPHSFHFKMAVYMDLKLYAKLTNINIR